MREGRPWWRSRCRGRAVDPPSSLRPEGQLRGQRSGASRRRGVGRPLINPSATVGAQAPSMAKAQAGPRGAPAGRLINAGIKLPREIRDDNFPANGITGAAARTAAGTPRHATPRHVEAALRLYILSRWNATSSSKSTWPGSPRPQSSPAHACSPQAGSAGCPPGEPPGHAGPAGPPAGKGGARAKVAGHWPQGRRPRGAPPLTRGPYVARRPNVSPAISAVYRGKQVHYTEVLLKLRPSAARPGKAFRPSEGLTAPDSRPSAGARQDMALTRRLV